MIIREPKNNNEVLYNFFSNEIMEIDSKIRKLKFEINKLSAKQREYKRGRRKLIELRRLLNIEVRKWNIQIYLKIGK